MQVGSCACMCTNAADLEAGSYSVNSKEECAQGKLPRLFSDGAHG